MLDALLTSLPPTGRCSASARERPTPRRRRAGHGRTRRAGAPWPAWPPRCRAVAIGHRRCSAVTCRMPRPPPRASPPPWRTSPTPTRSWAWTATATCSRSSRHTGPAALRAASQSDRRGHPLRRLLDRLRLESTPSPQQASLDVDTPEDLEAARHRLEPMKAITIPQPGDADALVLDDVPEPEPAAGEVRIRVAAAGVNRADIMQRKGFYDPPPGSSPYPGLEVSGTVDALGDGVDGMVGGRRGVRAPRRRRLRRAGVRARRRRSCPCRPAWRSRTPPPCPRWSARCGPTSS